MLSVCLENFTEERVKKNRRKKKKIDSRATRSCSQNISDEGGGEKRGKREKGSRDRSTASGGWGTTKRQNIGQVKNKGGKKKLNTLFLIQTFARQRETVSRGDTGGAIYY